MAETFEGLWKKLMVYAPDCPLPLAQEFVNTAYSRALSAGPWEGLRAESGFIVSDPLSVTVSTTKNSATVGCTSASANQVGLQLYVTHAPFYTIISATPGISLVLDRVWGGTTASQAGTIQQVYLTTPSDFLHFLAVRDTDLNWRLRQGYTQEQIDVWDAQRAITGDAWIVASVSSSPVTATLGVPRYELWPRPHAGKTYAYEYIKKPALMSAASDTPIFPIRGDVLKHGAMAELSLWPGTAERKNPYFNMDLGREFEGKFQLDLISCRREDQEIAQTAVSYASEDVPWAPLSLDFIQQQYITI